MMSIALLSLLLVSAHAFVPGGAMPRATCASHHCAPAFVVAAIAEDNVVSVTALDKVAAGLATERVITSVTVAPPSHLGIVK